MQGGPTLFRLVIFHPKKEVTDFFYLLAVRGTIRIPFPEGQVYPP